MPLEVFDVLKAFNDNGAAGFRDKLEQLQAQTARKIDLEKEVDSADETEAEADGEEGDQNPSAI